MVRLWVSRFSLRRILRYKEVPPEGSMNVAVGATAAFVCCVLLLAAVNVSPFTLRLDVAAAVAVTIILAAADACLVERLVSAVGRHRERLLKRLHVYRKAAKGAWPAQSLWCYRGLRFAKNEAYQREHKQTGRAGNQELHSLRFINPLDHASPPFAEGSTAAVALRALWVALCFAFSNDYYLRLACYILSAASIVLPGILLLCSHGACQGGLSHWQYRI
ncbi:MAG: hypothetical protein M0031_09965 [Thermaerobacter sp.]|jgi:hypothetical protein|nr:hypothetical protein [Thermaerobacter sp.]